jgi:hypothetical protein
MDPLRMMELGVEGTFKRRLKPDAAPNVPLASPDPEKKMAKLQLFNTYTFAGEHHRSVKRPRYMIFNITYVQRLVENIDNN